MLAGWVTFPVSGEEPSEIDVLDQDGLKWIKPVRPLDKFYPQGFTVTPGLFGARYTPPLRGTNALNWTNGLAALLGGNVPESLAPLVIPVWLSNNVVRVSGTNTNNFSLTFTSANGLFSGLFKHPATGRPAAFKGAVIQARPSHLGAGWFLGTNQSGSISLLAPPPDM